MLDAITPLLLTFDELPNLDRTLAPLAWAKRIVVVDSGSTDGTVERLRAEPHVDVVHRPFDAHASQWEFGLRKCGIDTPWILALDADHQLTPGLVEELRTLAPAAPTAGFECRFDYAIHGRRLRSAIYPPRLVLVRREAARFLQDGHTQRLLVDGAVERLRGRIVHDDRKPRARFLRNQAAYAAPEAEKLLASDARLSPSGRLRRAGWIAPWLVPLWCLVGRGGLFDGPAGWIYAGERAIAEWLLAMELFARRSRRR
jgi:glycosyltransferase involved in cell wall biosynthesis